MEFFTLPATTRWIFITSLVMLLVMSVYRYLLSSILLPAGVSGDLLVAGGRADAGVAGIMGLVASAFSLNPRWHPYLERKGTRLHVRWFTIFASLVILVFIADIYWVKSYGSRLSGSGWWYHMVNPGKAIRTDFPVLPLLAGAVVMAVLWWFLVKWLHDVLGAMRRPGLPGLRRFWQVVIAMVYLASLIVSFSTLFSIGKDGLSIRISGSSAMEANPFFTFFFR